VLSAAFMGVEEFSNTFNSITAHSIENSSIFERIFRPLSLSLTTLFPFVLIDSGLFVASFIFIICLIYTIFEDRKMLPIYLVLLIPIARFTVINGHSTLLYYFTYRAMLCFTFIISITIMRMIRNILKSSS
jgi:hypothetical protein